MTVVHEDGTITVLPGEEVAKINRSTESWSVELVFADGSTLRLGMLGDLQVTGESIEVDPYGTAPLAALASLTAPVPGRFSARVIGQDGEQSDIVSDLTPSGMEHELLVLGLYGGYTNEVEFTFTREDGTPRVSSTIEVPIEPLPDQYFDFSVVVPYPDEVPNGLVYMVNVTSLGVPFFVDPFGKIRYVLALPIGTGALRGTRGVQRLRNGNLGFAYLEEDQVKEFTWAGEEVGSWGVRPDFKTIHHDAFEKPNGNFLVPVYEVGASTVEDHVVELERDTGAIVRVWDLRESLQYDRRALVDDDTDWIHINGVVYDETDDSIIVSGQRQGVCKLTAENQLVWILAPREGWSDEFLPYVLELEPGSAPPFGQHAPQLRPNGNVLVFDNGLGRNFSDEQQYSRIVEYEISPNAKGGGGSARQVFEYGADRLELFSPIISDVDHYEEDGHRLMVAGSISAIMVYDGPDAFRTIWDRSQLEKARIVELDAEGKVYFEMAAFGAGKGSIYRAERMYLHP